MKLRSTAPVFLVADVGATIRWYETNLGFKGSGWPEKPPHAFGIMVRDDVEIMLQALPGYEKPDLYEKRAGGVWNVYVRMKGVRELYDAVRKSAEVTIIEELCPQPYGEIHFIMRDLNGYVLVFGEPM